MAPLLACAMLLASADVSPPLEQKVAEVLGKPVLLKDISPRQPLAQDALDSFRAQMLLSRIWSAFREDYAQKNGLTATAEDVDAYLKVMDTPELRAILAKASKDAGVPDMSQSPELMAMRRQMATSAVISWKVNAALFKKYGGAVIFQQADPLEPIDAYRDYFREAERRGYLVFFDPSLKKGFWDYFKNPLRPMKPKDIDFSQPWWLKKQR